MSGGSWDYLYCKVDEAAERLLRSRKHARKALGKKLKLISVALHDIEWEDSGDGADENKSIKNALGENAELLIAKEIIDDANKIHYLLGETLTKLQEII